MSSGGANILDIAEVAKSTVPAVPAAAQLPPNPSIDEKRKSFLADAVSIDASDISDEDLQTLPRVKGAIPWTVCMKFCSQRMTLARILNSFTRRTPLLLLSFANVSATTAPL